jgi:thiamine-phosphate pyrophosphorylase
MTKAPIPQPTGCRVYLITPPRLDLTAFQRAFTEALDAGDVAAVQLRLKDTDDDTWKRAIDALRPIAQSRNVSFLLNDRVDLVKPTGCDGVHVGQEDMPAPDARRILGPDLTVGVTCKGSRHLSMQAAEDGADYVAFGAFFPSTTKDVATTISPEIIAWWSELMELPSCAIGGITSENCADIVKAGADFLAVAGCVWNDLDGPAAAIRKLNAAIKAASP